jgi:hypothetical protein
VVCCDYVCVPHKHSSLLSDLRENDEQEEACGQLNVTFFLVILHEERKVCNIKVTVYKSSLVLTGKFVAVASSSSLLYSHLSLSSPLYLPNQVGGCSGNAVDIYAGYL